MTIRWGILGCGDVARRRVAAAIQQQSDSVLQAVCRRNEQKLQQFCDDFHVPDSYSDSQQLLTATNIDAVYIATPVKKGAV